MEKSKAGRKPIKDKIETVNLFIRTSEIKEHGGLINLQDKCYKMLGVKKA